MTTQAHAHQQRHCTNIHTACMYKSYYTLNVVIQTLNFLSCFSKASITIRTACSVRSNLLSWLLKRYMLPLTSTTRRMRFGSS